MENLVTFLLIAAGVAVGEILFTLATAVWLYFRRNSRKAEFQQMLDAFGGLENETPESAHV